MRRGIDERVPQTLRSSAPARHNSLAAGLGRVWSTQLVPEDGAAYRPLRPSKLDRFENLCLSFFLGILSGAVNTLRYASGH